VACAAGIANLDIFREKQLFTRAAAIADQWQEAMHSLRGLPHVQDIRTIGLIAGIELASRPDSPGSRGFDLFIDCFEKGLLIRVTGDIVALSPPLIIESSDIDNIVSVLGDALRKVA
jgi:beta-alanine--pyruvate transaminase